MLREWMQRALLVPCCILTLLSSSRAQSPFWPTSQPCKVEATQKTNGISSTLILRCIIVCRDPNFLDFLAKGGSVHADLSNPSCKLMPPYAGDFCGKDIQNMSDHHFARVRCWWFGCEKEPTPAFKFASLKRRTKVRLQPY